MTSNVVVPIVILLLAGFTVFGVLKMRRDTKLEEQKQRQQQKRDAKALRGWVRGERKRRIETEESSPVEA